MKNLLLTIFALCLTQILMAQITAAEYLKRAPEIPVNVCKATASEQAAFSDALQKLSYAMREDANNRRMEAEQSRMEAEHTKMEAEHSRMEAEHSKMSREDAQRLQTDEERTDSEVREQKTNIPPE